MKYFEQDGNIFKEDNGKIEYVPERFEQEGNVFQFNKKTKDYEYVGDIAPVETPQTYENAAPVSLTAKPIEALKGLGERALKGVAYVGEQIDRYTGAPTRAAISSALKGQSPLQSFIGQFGRDPNLAPTGKDIAGKQLGFSEEEYMEIPGVGYKFSPAGLVGLGVDITADPTNVIPGRAAIGLGVKGATKTAGAGLDVARMAANVATKGKYEQVEKGIVASAKGIKEAFDRYISKPTVSSDFATMADIAKRNNIDPSILPESIEFGEASAINRAARAVRESPAGQDELVKFISAQDKVNNALENKISAIANNTSRSTLQAGKALRDGYDEAVDNLFKNIDFTYGEIIRQAPDITVTKSEAKRLYDVAENIKKESMTKLDGYTTSLQTKQLNENIKAAEAIQNSLFKKVDEIKKDKKGNEFTKTKLVDQPETFKKLYQSMANIGEASYKNKNIITEIPPDLKTMRKLYSEIRKSLVESTGARLGKTIQNSLEKNNEMLTEFYKTRDSVFNKINDSKTSGEELFKSIVINGNTDQVRDIVKLMPDKLPELKGAFLESITPRNVDGDILYSGLSKALKRKEEIVKILFNPQEIKEIGELISLGSSFGPAVLSTSGTGASLSYQNLGKAIKEFTINKTALDYMKSEARKIGTKLPPPQSSAPMAPQTIIQQLTAPRQGIERGSKPAQVYSVQERNKEDEAIKRKLQFLR